jgi:hypothetical protein
MDAPAGDITGATERPSIVRDLGVLTQAGTKFTTIYADPPWPYHNTAARGAAENHYPTPSLEAIRSEPLPELAHSPPQRTQQETVCFPRPDSPGPYLEMYGREEQRDCGWTVCGDQIERRLF